MTKIREDYDAMHRRFSWIYGSSQQISSPRRMNVRPRPPYARYGAPQNMSREYPTTNWNPTESEMQEMSKRRISAAGRAKSQIGICCWIVAALAKKPVRTLSFLRSGYWKRRIEKKAEWNILTPLKNVKILHLTFDQYRRWEPEDGPRDRYVLG